jgi:arylsulfatase A
VLIDAPTGDDNGGPRGAGEPDWFRRDRGYAAHGEPGELYNLREDPGQRMNLFAAKLEVVADLRALLEKYRREGRSVSRAQ